MIFSRNFCLRLQMKYLTSESDFNVFLENKNGCQALDLIERLIADATQGILGNWNPVTFIWHHFGIPKSFLECQAFNTNIIHWHFFSWHTGVSNKSVQTHFFTLWEINKILGVYKGSILKAVQIKWTYVMFTVHNWTLNKSS